MNEIPAEYFAESYSQLGSISALLGGLVFAAAASLLNTAAGTSDPRALDRPAALTAGSAVLSSVCLVVAALAWTLMAAQSFQDAGTDQPVPETIHQLNLTATYVFMGGLALFFASVGSSGWIGSPKLGLATTAAAAIGSIAALLIVLQFM